jgi:anti-sigma regulatory factor (Ser/Thr protein kinase)
MARRAVLDDLLDIGPAIAWVAEVTAGAGLSGDLRFAIDLCLEEALANLILHGQAPGGPKDIVLEVSADAAGALIVISDRCAAYDVAEAALPPAPGLESEREGGRGLRLLRSFASDLAYETAGGLNALTLTFRPAG